MACRLAEKEKRFKTAPHDDQPNSMLFDFDKECSWALFLRAPGDPRIRPWLRIRRFFLAFSKTPTNASLLRSVSLGIPFVRSAASKFVGSSSVPTPSAYSLKSTLSLPQASRHYPHAVSTLVCPPLLTWIEGARSAFRNQKAQEEVT